MNSRIISKDEKLKQIKSKVDFENIKSVFILRKLFDFMKKDKSLAIIQYNKKLQKILNLSINDYKEYSQLYSSIEIELKPVDCIINNFINIPDDEKEYYHIYFDNSNEEIKRNYLTKREKVKTIKIIINYQVTSFKGLFYQCKCISSIFFKKFKRINITDMSSMFRECKSLKELNFTNFNTKNVTDLSSMFDGCSSLKELDLSNFNTNKVKYMNHMFYGCIYLEKINISNFDTINVIDMKSMFSWCSSLKELNFSSFDTKNVTNLSCMFFFKRIKSFKF